MENEGKRFSSLRINGDGNAEFIKHALDKAKKSAITALSGDIDDFTLMTRKGDHAQSFGYAKGFEGQVKTMIQCYTRIGQIVKDMQPHEVILAMQAVVKYMESQG